MIINQSKRSVLRFKSSTFMIEEFNTYNVYQGIKRSNRLLDSNTFQYVKMKDLNEIKDTYK